MKELMSKKNKVKNKWNKKWNIKWKKLIKNKNKE